MKTVSSENAGQLDDLLKSGEEEVVVTRNGRAVALVIPMDEDDLEFYEREQGVEFIDSISRARAQIKAGKTVRQEGLRKEMGEE